MKRIIFAFTFLCFVGIADTYAQTVAEPIEIIEKGAIFKKEVYKKCGIEMTPTQLITLFKDDQNMQAYVKPIGLNYLAKVLLSTTASALVLIPLVDSFSDSEGDEPNWNLAYIGAGCALLSIPFDRWFRKNAKEAVEYYNSGYQTGEIYSPKLNLQLGNNGLGLALKF